MHRSPKTHNLVKNKNQWSTRKPEKQKKQKKQAEKFNSNDFIFTLVGKAFDRLSPAEKLVFFLALSSAVSSALAVPQPINNEIKHTNLTTTNQVSAKIDSTKVTNITNVNSTSCLANNTIFNKPPITQYKNVEVHVIHTNSTIKNCSVKKVGGNAGKKCDVNINGKFIPHMLKVVDVDNKNQETTTTDAVLSQYNSRLLKNMHVKTPNMRFFYEQGGQYITSSGETVIAELYHGSEFVNDFQSFSSFIDSIKSNKAYYEKAYQSFTYKEIIRAELVKKIGEDGIASLAVASTFVNDIIGNPDNWGFSGNNLVIIDVDNSPQSYNDYYDTATYMPSFFEDEGISLSVNNLKKIISIYQAMLAKPVPQLHSEVDISEKFYKLILEKYIAACTDSLHQLKNICKEDVPDVRVNHVLSVNLKNQLKDFINNIKPNFGL